MNREDVNTEFLNMYNYYKDNNLNPLVLKVGIRPEPKLQDKNYDIKVNFYLNDNIDIYDIIALYRLENDVDCLLIEDTEMISDKSLKELLKVLTVLHIPIMFFDRKEKVKVRKKLNI